MIHMYATYIMQVYDSTLFFSTVNFVNSTFCWFHTVAIQLHAFHSLASRIIWNGKIPSYFCFIFVIRCIFSTIFFPFIFTVLVIWLYFRFGSRAPNMLMEWSVKQQVYSIPYIFYFIVISSSDKMKTKWNIIRV